MAFIFLFFIFSNFIKAENTNIDSDYEINLLEDISTKGFSKSSFLKEIPRTKVSIKEKNSLSTRNPFLPFGNDISDGTSGFKFSELALTGIASINGEEVAFIRTSAGTFPYQVGGIIGSGFKLLNIDYKNLTIQISNDITTHLITLEEDEK